MDLICKKCAKAKRHECNGDKEKTDGLCLMFEGIKDEDEKREQSYRNDLWMPLFLSLFSNMKTPYSSPDTEQEIAYLHGKVDTLEDIVIADHKRR